MAYYDAMIAKWPTLQPGTTDQKLVEINSIMVTGSIPTTIYVTGDQVFNCVDHGEFMAAGVTDAQRLNLLTMLTTPGLLLGGSANTSHLLVGMLLDMFPTNGPTIAALTALAKASTVTWCIANGYPNAQNRHDYGGLTTTDCLNAGLV